MKFKRIARSYNTVIKYPYGEWAKTEFNPGDEIFDPDTHRTFTLKNMYDTEQIKTKYREQIIEHWTVENWDDYEVEIIFSNGFKKAQIVKK
jgi:hypothetical protein